MFGKPHKTDCTRLYKATIIKNAKILQGKSVTKRTKMVLNRCRASMAERMRAEQQVEQKAKSEIVLSNKFEKFIEKAVLLRVHNPYV